MGISSRIHDTIEQWQAEWKDRLRGWMISWVEKGMTTFIETIEPDAIDNVRTILTGIKEDPNTPQDMKDLVDRALAPGHPLPLFLVIPIAILLFIPTVTSIFQPLGNIIRYKQERFFKSGRLDPLSVINAWRRDPAKYQRWFEDLRDQGFNDDRIDVMDFATKAFPSLRDVIGFYAHEVFEPDMIERYGLREELPPYAGTLFEKLGVPKDIADLYWIDHWEHASFVQVVEMLHRKLLTEKDVWEWFRLVEIPPFWREKLIQVAYTWPTRVDVRRWWDMRTIDEARLRELYEGMGYRGKNLDDYVNWTKVYVDFPIKMAHFTNGWITEDNIRDWLANLGIPAARIEDFIREKTKPAKAERVATDKNLTMALIVEGVKKGVISRAEGIESLVDIGYDEAEAEFILDVRIPVDEELKVVKERELTKSDIYAGLKDKILTETEALSKLLELRYTLDDATFLMTIFKARIEPPVEARDREASKADIVLAVKKGLITPEDGYLMLQDIGFTPEAAQFILMVHAESTPFSPMTAMEFRDITQKWRAAVGVPAKPVSEELKKAAAEVVRLTEDVENLTRAVEEERKTIVDEEGAAPEVVKKLTELRVALRRAEAELHRAKTNYDSLLAQWRHEEAK